jgi:hypothetical protein
MNSPKLVQQVIGVMSVTVFLVGCIAPTATPTTIPTLPLPPPATPQTPPSPPPPSAQPASPSTQGPQPGGQSKLFKFIRTVPVTPDDNFKNGSFARINYVPATDRFVVTFATRAGLQQSDCKGTGVAYKEYSTDMQATGKSGHIVWNPTGCVGVIGVR